MRETGWKPKLPTLLSLCDLWIVLWAMAWPTFLTEEELNVC
jgi:hypothetical protein